MYKNRAPEEEYICIALLKHHKMKNLRINTIFIALAMMPLFTSVSRAGSFEITSTSPIYTLITAEAGQIFTELLCHVQYFDNKNSYSSFEIAEETEVLMEESLELEEWMMDFNWEEKEEAYTEKELKLEVWMKRPKNWNIYFCEDKLSKQ